MNKIKKLHLLLPMISALAILLLLSLTQPKAENIAPVLLFLGLCYIFSASVVNLLLVLVNKDKKSRVQIALLAGCLPPALIVLGTLRQASLFDISLIVITVALLIWYVLNRK